MSKTLQILIVVVGATVLTAGIVWFKLYMNDIQYGGDRTCLVADCVISK